MRYVTFDEKKLAYVRAARDGLTPECVKCVRKDDGDQGSSGTGGFDSAEKAENVGRDKKVLCPDGAVIPIPSNAFVPLLDVLTTSEVNVSLLGKTANPANVRGLAGRDYTVPTDGGGAEFIGAIRVFGICPNTSDFLAKTLAKAYGLVYHEVIQDAAAGLDTHSVIQEQVLTDILALFPIEDTIESLAVLQQVVRNASRDAYKQSFPTQFTDAYTAALDIGTILKNAAQASKEQVYGGMLESAVRSTLSHIGNDAIKKTLLFAADDAYFELFETYTEDFQTSANALATDAFAKASVGSTKAGALLEDYLSETESEAPTLFGNDWKIRTKKFQYEPTPSILSFAAYPDTPMSAGGPVSGGTWLLYAETKFNLAIFSDTLNYRFRI